MTGQSQQLSLLENSHKFTREAVNKAVAARQDSSQWVFAIFHVVQAAELLLKEKLRREHPVFIYKNIDDPKTTVSFQDALARIENQHILNQPIPAYERKRITSAISLRNQITHSSFEVEEPFAMAKFSELFAFVAYFSGRHLNVEIKDVLDRGQIKSVIDIEKCFAELKTKALQRIEDEGLSPNKAWECPHCGQLTFIVEDDQDVCFLRRQQERVLECPQCERPAFDFEMQEFHDLIETDYADGHEQIMESYGYSTFYACPDCISAVRDDIENQRAEQEYRWREEEWRARNTG